MPFYLFFYLAFTSDSMCNQGIIWKLISTLFQQVVSAHS